ncbi:sortase-dependent protein [Kitasatospora sp. NPDC001261]|uniref:sortase-dependent protein n=1 Tax=Kitasatospora sp. NPDC001261 TaxID=3364012 RepID=UPI0036A8A427
MSRSRTHHSPARRVLAACALTGAALLATVTGGQAWADGAPKPAAPSAAPAGDAAVRTAPPAPATPSAAPKPEASPAVAAPKGAAPAPAAPGGAQPQVREVPKGAAQAGDGSTASDGSGLMLAGGGTVAAVGAAGLGFALLRRRSGARG